MLCLYIAYINSKKQMFYGFIIMYIVAGVVCLFPMILGEYQFDTLIQHRERRMDGAGRYLRRSQP